MTNLSDEEVDRIIFYKLSPINISIHTTNEELRCKMLNNRFAGSSLAKMKRLKDAGITMNGQIVLCKGWNDKEELEKTIHDLSAFLPEMQSVSIVPVGITKFREKLTPLESFTNDDAIEVLNIIHRWQAIFLKHYNTRFIYAGDEWYINAKLPIPDEDAYEGYPQIENGVGMLRSFNDEFYSYLNELTGDTRVNELSIVTGRLASQYITQMSKDIMAKYPNISINIYTINNDFFGENITVVGLLTGKDIIEQLKGKNLGNTLLLLVFCFARENILLDDVTIGILKELYKQESVLYNQMESLSLKPY